MRNDYLGKLIGRALLVCFVLSTSAALVLLVWWPGSPWGVVVAFAAAVTTGTIVWRGVWFG